MVYDYTNCLRGKFSNLQAREVRELAREIPEERREGLLEEIKARAMLNGIANRRAYKMALRSLA